MRLGMATPLQHDSPTHWAEQLKAIGCGAVVFPLDYRASEKQIHAYAEAARQYDLMIAEVGIWQNPLAEDPQERRRAREYSVGQLRLADALGARCCVNVAGAIRGPRWDGGYKENYSAEAWQRTVEYTQELIDCVQPKHTFYTLEPMPWMIPSSPEEYVKLLAAVGRERLAVHMDMVNMINCPERCFFAEDFMDRCFRLLGGKIRSCHLKDVRLLPELTFRLAEVACGEGDFPLEHYVRLAQASDPDMPVIIEHLRTDEAYLASLRYVRERPAKMPEFHGELNAYV